MEDEGFTVEEDDRRTGHMLFCRGPFNLSVLFDEGSTDTDSWYFWRSVLFRIGQADGDGEIIKPDFETFLGETIEMVRKAASK